MTFAKNIGYMSLVNKTNDREKNGELMKFIFCLTLFQGRISLSSPHQFGFVRCLKYSHFFLLFLYKNILFYVIYYPFCFLFVTFPFFVNCEIVDGCLNFSQFFDIDGNSQVLVAFLHFFPSCRSVVNDEEHNPDTVGT